MPLPRPEPETAADRDARQFAGLHVLGDFALALATVAAQAALAEAAPEPGRKARPMPAPKPPRAHDHVLDFVRTSRAYRQTVALELRVAAGPAGRHRPAYRSPVADDPRRVLIRQTLYQAVAKHPDRPDRCREIDRTVDAQLLADPAGLHPIDETFGAICRSLGIHIDMSKVPDALLGLAPIGPAPINAAPPRPG